MSPEGKLALKRASMILIIGGGFLIAALAIGWIQMQRPPQPVADSSPVPIGGAFTLVDEDGRTVTDQTYRGKWLLVFFGFTHCPDVCPTALNDIALTMDQLGPQAQSVQPLFVTVDPERDTPDVVKEYTEAFHPSIIGLTGSLEQVAQAAKVYRVYYKKVPQDEGYTMDHSGITYVMNPDGKFAAHFSPHTPIDTMAGKLRSLIAGK